MKRLNTFHHQCIRSVLGIRNKQQWEEHISSEMIRKRWEDEETITTKLMKRHLEWLGHVARMSNSRIPKINLFSWLAQPCPRYGPKRWWRDTVKKDLQKANICNINRTYYYHYLLYMYVYACVMPCECARARADSYV